MMKYASLSIMLALCACSSSEPSESDIQQALQARDSSVEVTDIEKTQCSDAGEGRMRCTFVATGRSGDMTRTKELSRVFEKMESGWVIARR